MRDVSAIRLQPVIEMDGGVNFYLNLEAQGDYTYLRLMVDGESIPLDYPVTVRSARTIETDASEVVVWSGMFDNKALKIIRDLETGCLKRIPSSPSSSSSPSSP